MRGIIVCQNGQATLTAELCTSLYGCQIGRSWDIEMAAVCVTELGREGEGESVGVCEREMGRGIKLLQSPW